MDLSVLFRLNKRDFVNGAVTAVFTAVVAVLWSSAQQPNFNVFMIDWMAVLNAAVYGFIGYLSKKFATDSEGKIFGKIG